MEFTQTKTFCLLPLWSCSPPGHRSGADEARKQTSVFSMSSHQASYFHDWSQCHTRRREDGKRASQSIVPEQWMCFSCWHPPGCRDKCAPLRPSNRSQAARIRMDCTVPGGQKRLKKKKRLSWLVKNCRIQQPLRQKKLNFYFVLENDKCYNTLEIQTACFLFIYYIKVNKICESS